MPPTVAPDRYQQTQAISWDRLHRDCKTLARKLAQVSAPGGFAGVVAITRGGLIPAAIVSRELDIRRIDTFSVVGYPWQLQDHAAAPKPLAPAMAGDGHGWLLVDDLSDTGQTLRLARELLPRAHVATLYVKPLGRALVDTFVAEVGQDTWVLQPWESEPRGPEGSDGLRFAEPLMVPGQGR